MARTLLFRRAVSHVLYLLLLCIYFQITSSGKCNLLDTPGITVPQGDITIEYGDPLEIYCILHDEYIQQHENTSSEDMIFLKNNSSVAEQLVTIVNRTTIRLYVKEPPASNDVYTCKFKEQENAICFNIVAIGTKPQPVNDFSCIGYNYENLTCTWDTPQNYVKTNYSLSYYFQGRGNRRMSYMCPNMSVSESGRKMHCFWSLQTSPQYRIIQPTYHFNLTAINVFGNLTKKYIIQHFANVIPGPPENLKVINKGSNFITLSWSVPKPMVNFPPGFVHRIIYQSEFDTENVWHMEIADKISNKSHPEFNLTGLQYAHTLYDIRVSMRSARAAATSEQMWSKNTSVTVRTLSAVPGAPPAVTIGSFELVKNNTGRDIYVYWQSIPPTMKNGENFTYNVKSITQDGEPRTLKLAEKTNAYAKYTGLNNKSYRFEIISANEVGNSVNSSILYLPSAEDLLPDPGAFTKIAFGDGIYELSWVPPKINIITNYTIFYCNNEHDRPFQCKGLLKWVVIPNNITMYNITVPEDKTYQFAIAANSETSSSGMVWATCTVIHNKRLTKMKNLWIADTGSTFILVAWKLDCSDRIGSIEGFNIEYCPIISPVEADCKEPTRNLTINDPEADRANVTKLKSYTTYMVKVSVISKHHRFGLQSDPLYNTTYEGAPDPPRNLVVYNVTNNSIALEWSPPAAMNGVLRFYEVHYTADNQTHKAKPTNETDNKIVLRDLNSFTNYTISVVAWTSLRSQPSEKIIVMTIVAMPGVVRGPTITFQNESVYMISWSPPSNPRGELNLYELRIRKSSDAENETIIEKTNETEMVVPTCANDKSYKSIFFSVRAVNIDGTKRLEGPWSPEIENYCRISSSYVYWLVFIICLFTVFVASMVLKKAYSCCQDMSDVDVKLPPGLITPTATTDISLTHWNNSTLPKSVADDSSIRAHTNSSPDEQHLLSKGENHDRLNSGDSSGCSSGHESVTSSLESGTNLTSTSDSGTEQPRTPSSESASRENSLRLRKTGSDTFWDSEIAWPNTKGYVLPAPGNEKTGPNWVPVKSGTGNSYCVLGVNSGGTPPEPSHGYVPVSLAMSGSEPLDEVKSSPYVTCDQLQSTESAPLNPPYVKTSELVSKAGGNASTIKFPSGGTPEQASDTSPLYVVAGTNNMSRPYIKAKTMDKLNTGMSRLINLEAAHVQVEPEASPVLAPSYVKTGELCAGSSRKDECAQPPAYVKTDMIALPVAVAVAGVELADDSTSDEAGADEELPLKPYNWREDGSSSEGGSRDPAPADTTAAAPLHRKPAAPSKGYVPHRHFENKSLKED